MGIAVLASVYSRSIEEFKVCHSHPGRLVQVRVVGGSGDLSSKWSTKMSYKVLI